MYTLVDFFRETISRSLGGAAPWNFFYALEIEQGYLAHTQTGTIFTMPDCKNLWRQKIVQSFSQFLTTFDFDCKYLRKRSTYQKSEKLLIIYNPSHVGRKKVGVLWSTNEKVIDSNKFTP